MPGAPDAEILSQFVQGDQAAFEQLFRLYDADVYGWVMRIVRDASTADDVLVEAFWRAYRGRARFDPTRSFGAWIRRIATNAALDELRSVRRRGRQLADDTLPAPRAADRDVNDAIDLSFRRLPPELQAVAALALIEEQPYADIADALEIPIGTVKSRVFRATRFLREELARLGVRPC